MNFAMNSRGCIYVKKKSVFLVRNNRERERERERVQLILIYMCMFAVCVSSGMSKSFKLLVIQGHCFRVNVKFVSISIVCHLLN